MAKPIIPNSRDLVAEAMTAKIRKADAQRDAARAMLAALRNPAGLSDETLEHGSIHVLRQAVREYREEARAAIAAAKAAGITEDR